MDEKVEGVGEEWGCKTYGVDRTDNLVDWVDGCDKKGTCLKKKK